MVASKTRVVLACSAARAAFSAPRPLIEATPVNASPTSADVAASSRWTACDCGPRRPVQAVGVPHQPGADVPLDQESQALRPPPA